MRLDGEMPESDSQPASASARIAPTKATTALLRSNAFMRPDLVALRETAGVAQRGAYGLVELRRQLDERQPQFVFDESHLGERPFGGCRIRLDEEPAMQREQAVVVVARCGDV